VPVNRGEEEFATGRLTQAEILDKYGLHDQALQQVREVIERFPGSVDAQEKLVLFVRTANDRTQLRDALIGLALARKAVGDLDEAKEAAAEARRNGPLDETMLEQLDQLGLLESQEPEPQAEEPKTEQPEQQSAPTDTNDKVVLIDFDGLDDGEEAEEIAEAKLPMPIPPATPPVAAVAPGPVESAPRQAAPADPQPERAPEPPPVAQEAAAVSSTELIGDDLSAITAALDWRVGTEP